jgi:hypothetical protein
MLACLVRSLCFTRTDIDKAHELPSQSSPRLYTPNHVPRSLTAVPQLQRPLPPTDGTEDVDSMPPKRKNADTSAAMDRPEKKTKTARKGRKAAPAEEEGRPIFLSSFINMHATFIKIVSLVRRGLAIRVSLVAAALIPRLGCTNKGPMVGCRRGRLQLLPRRCVTSRPRYREPTPTALYLAVRVGYRPSEHSYFLSFTSSLPRPPYPPSHHSSCNPATVARLTTCA